MLAEALAEYKELNLRNKYCVVGNWSKTFTEEDLAQFKIALEDDSFSTKDLYVVFNKIGAPFSLESLRRHRNQECSCQN